MILEVGFTRSPGLAPSQRLGLGFPTDRPQKASLLPRRTEALDSTEPPPQTLEGARSSGRG